MTEEIRSYIPSLAGYQDGVLCSFLESCIQGISPFHYVPDLQLSYHINKIQSPKSPKTDTTSRNPRNKKMRSKTSRRNQQKKSHVDKVIDGLQITEIRLPHTKNRPNSARTISSARRKKSTQNAPKNILPPMIQTQDDVISKLYIQDSRTFYTAKKLHKESLDYHIVPPNYSKHAIGPKFSMISNSGVVSIENKKSSFVDLPQFFEDHTNTFIVESQTFKLHNAFRCFYTWLDRYRQKILKKVVHSLDEHNSVCTPGFQELLDRIRFDIITKTSELMIYDHSFDQTNDDVDFKELQDQANISLQEMENCVSCLKKDVEDTLSDFFRQICATNFLMQLDFDELHSLNALPESLKTFASDLKWKNPSIWREKLRENLLKKERIIAMKRQEYLGQFFIRVNSIYSGNLILQCKRITTEFIERFATTCSKRRRIHRLHATFDFDKGMKIEPSKKTFLKFVLLTIEEIKLAFITPEKQLSINVIKDIDPEFDFLRENSDTILNSFSDFQKLFVNSENEINSVYTFFDLEMHNHAFFLKKLKDTVDKANSVEDLRDIDCLDKVIQELVDIENELINKPRTIFHKIFEDEIDFALDLKPAFGMAAKYLEENINNFKSRILNELNNVIFTEIQEKWAAAKETLINRDDCRYLEIRFVLYAILCDTTCTMWSDLINKVKGSFDTIMRIYRLLNDRCHYTHIEAIESFNSAAEKIGIGLVTPKKVQYIDSESESEEEEEEDAIEENPIDENNEELASDEGDEDIVKKEGVTLTQTESQTD